MSKEEKPPSVGVQHREPAWPRQGGEFREGLPDPLDGGEVVHVVQLDVEDHGDGRAEIEEGIHVFAGFEGEEILFPDPVDGTGLEHGRAVEHRGIDPSFGEDPAEHPGGGALSVGTRDADPHAASGHEPAEEVGPGDQRDPVLLRPGVFRVGLRHGDGVDQGIRVLHVLRVGFVIDRDPHFFKPRGDGGGGAVVARDGESSEGGEDREGIHAHAPDPGEENSVFSREYTLNTVGSEMRIGKCHAAFVLVSAEMARDPCCSRNRAVRGNPLRGGLESIIKF